MHHGRALARARTTPTTTDQECHHTMTDKAERKIVQYLHEAHATESLQFHTLSAHIAITPAGSYRDGLEAHLATTRGHADRIQRLLEKRAEVRSLLTLGYGAAANVAGQVLAMGKFPIDLARGMSAEEKLLKNARDECASEALEIAFYVALEQIAREVGDGEVERLAASIRKDEQAMLDRLVEEIPRLAANVVSAEVEGAPTYDARRTGAVDTARSVAGTAARTVARTATRAARRADQLPRTTRKATPTPPSKGPRSASPRSGSSSKGARSGSRKRSTSRS